MSRRFCARASRPRWGRIAFFVVPSATGFLVLGDQVADLIYRGGRFSQTDARWVWAVLAGSAIGLVASTLGRLFSSAFYALHDTRTPLRFALVRVTCSTAMGATFALLGPRALGIDVHWGAAGITLASGLAGWIEFTLLRRGLSRRIGKVGLSSRRLVTLWSAAGLAALVSFGARWVRVGLPSIIHAGALIGLFALVYWFAAWRFGAPEASEVSRRIFRRR